MARAKTSTVWQGLSMACNNYRLDMTAATFGVCVRL